jgi:predicted ATPase
MLGESERAHNLPVLRVALVGRDEHARLVRERVLAAERGLLTLTGAGGSGKTCLALHVAAGLLDQFRDGVWLVELASLGDATLVPGSVADSLGVREQPGRAIRETLLHALESRSLLLVLDNCEHVIEACADLAEGLLATCAGLRILATSREPLRIPGERIWQVPLLSTPDPRRLPPSVESVADFAAVRLFVERARAVLPSFALAEHNVGVVAQVCARLDGLPLALELAAARMRVLNVRQILERLDDSFRVLGPGSRTAPSRQQTLGATLDWSYQLLSEPEQRLLHRVAVFAGGFDLPAVEAIHAGIGTPELQALDLLALLVDKSLVLAEEHDADVRYRLLEPVRQYAQVLLAAAPAEQDMAQGRHAEYFLALGEGAATKQFGPEQAASFDRFEREHDNFRAALAWSQADPSRFDQGLRLAAALGWFWIHRGHWSEALAWFERVLATGRDAAARARVLESAGEVVRWQGDYTRAATLLAESQDLCRVVGDRRTLALAQIIRGSLALFQGDAHATALHEEAVALSRELDDPWLLAFSLEMLGEVQRTAGEINSAAACYEESLAVCRDIGDTRGTANALADLAHVALQRCDALAAIAGFKESLALARAIGVERRIVMALEGLAGAEVVSGNAERGAAVRGNRRLAPGAWRAVGAGRSCSLQPRSGGDARRIRSDRIPGGMGRRTNPHARSGHRRRARDGGDYALCWPCNWSSRPVA